MNILKSKIFLLVWLLSHFVWSQRIELKTMDPILCVNEGNGDLMIIEDSTEILIYNCKTKKRKTIKIESIDIPFHELKNEFIPIFKGGDLNFIERGCGRVLRLVKNRILRIDHSFSHRNQYDGAVTVFMDTIYYIGGYGFFTVKDLVTYYDEGLGQWLMKNHSLKQVHQIMEPAVAKDSDGLICFGGRYQKGSLVGDRYHRVNPAILKFTMNSGRWDSIGYLNPRLNKYLINRTQMNNHIIRTTDYLLFFDWSSKTVKILPHDFTIKTVLAYKGFLITNRMAGIQGISPVSFIEISDFNKYFRDKKGVVLPLLKVERKEVNSELWIISLFVLCISLIIVLILKSRRTKQHIEIPGDLAALLELWINSPDMRIELADLNPLVCYDNPELETLKKRREWLLKRLKQYLYELKITDAGEVYYVELSQRDRRVKLFVLNEAVAKWYNKVKR